LLVLLFCGWLYWRVNTAAQWQLVSAFFFVAAMWVQFSGSCSMHGMLQLSLLLGGYSRLYRCCGF
jgi:hypothetical protein